MTTQRLWAAFTAVVLGVATFASGPGAFVGNGIPTANAQSASSLVANVMGLMNATPVNQAKLDSAIAAAVAAGGPGMAASLMLTATAGGGRSAEKMVNAILATAKANPSLQAALGQGLAAAVQSLNNAGQNSIAGAITRTVDRTGGTTVVAAFTAAAPVVLPSPQQTCSGGSCN